MPPTESTIYFIANPPTGNSALLPIPTNATAKFPRDAAYVEGTINGFPFRAPPAANGKSGRSLNITEALRHAAGLNVEDAASIEITRIGDEPEVRLPRELQKALSASPKAHASWIDITPLARRDWILWITSAKQTQTRTIRIQKACSMLASGKRGVCCFGGLNWLTKDHPSVETWAPLPKCQNQKTAHPTRAALKSQKSESP
jgi:hypothetical protein